MSPGIEFPPIVNEPKLSQFPSFFTFLVTLAFTVLILNKYESYTIFISFYYNRCVPDLYTKFVSYIYCFVVRHLGGTSPSPEWQGSLNVSYNTGPGFIGPWEN